MKHYLIDNKQFILICLIWLVVGMYAGPIIYILLPVMLLLMYQKEMHLEILIGFFFILILSDSRSHQLRFAANAKNIYIILLFIFSLKKYKFIDFSIKIYQYFIPFFIISFICIFNSPVLFLSFQKTFSYIFLFVSVPFYFQYVYLLYGDKLFKSIVFLVISVLLLGLIINFISPDFTNLAGRYRGLLGNPNGLGLFVFLFILLFTTIIDFKKDLFSKNEKKIIYIIAFFSLLKCGTRTSLFATLLFFVFRKFYKISPVVGFFIFIVILFVYQLVSSNIEFLIIELGLSDFLRIETFTNLSGRSVAWEFAWQKIQNSFFIGRGFAFTEYIYKANATYLNLLGHQGSAHNSYLTLWLDVGLIGLTLFLVGLFITFIKAAKHSRLAVPILYAILLSNQYESWITASLNPFSIQLLVILTIIYLSNNRLTN